MLTETGLTDARLDEVIAFLRLANPFAEETWGWDAGRFMDWRWGSNAAREAAGPGWFSEHCRIFSATGRIRALAITESNGEETYVITPAEDPEVVRHALDALMARHSERGLGLLMPISAAAAWLGAIMRDAGLAERPRAGLEWEFDLTSVATEVDVPPGYAVGSLADEPPPSHEAVAECIRAAFNSRHDVPGALRSLEANPMFRPELSAVVLAPDGRVAAYCRGTVDPHRGIGGIDPVCCHPDFQRMGLARAVVRSCFAAQRSLGGRLSYIGSAPEPDAGASLYRSLGPSRCIEFTAWYLEPPTTAA